MNTDDGLNTNTTTTDQQNNNSNNNEHNSNEDYEIESPITPLDENEPIDFSLVYALHTFVANLEGQVCVIRGDSLELLDDTNSYWWLVKCVKTDEIGYIPAENIETPYERLARLNRQRNAKIDLNYVEPKPEIRSTPKMNIRFAKEPLVIYEDGEMEDGVYMDEVYREEDDASVESSNVPDKSNRTLSKSFRQSFLFSKLLKRTSSKDTTATTNGSTSSMDSNDSISQQQQGGGRNVLSPNDLSNLSEPINVLRIFAGNVDLKATFKTVAIRKNMIISDLIESALKKFRVPNAVPSEYYLAVLHMDSQEKRINEDEVVLDVLESLRHRSLPGVGDFTKISHARMKQGKISSVRVNDDEIIKIIINKKLNLFEKNYHLMRVFMYDENDPTGKIRHYKTVGADSKATVETVIRMSVKKFKLDANGYIFTLHSLFNNEEIKRQDNENIKSILTMAQGSAHDIDFILRREWVGAGTVPESKPQTTMMSADQLEDIMRHKPSFLEESGNGGGFSPEAQFIPLQESTSINSLSSVPNESAGNSLSRLSPDPRHQPDFQSPNIQQRQQSLQLHQQQQIQQQQQQQSLQLHQQQQIQQQIQQQQIQQQPQIVAPPRKMSLGNVAPQPTTQQQVVPPPRQTKDLPAPPQSDGGVIAAPVPETNTQKPNFKYMEQYLDEIMKDNMSLEKLTYLENRINPSNSSTGSTSNTTTTTTVTAAEINRTASPSSTTEYNDSGLRKIINRRSQMSLHRASTPKPRSDSPVSISSIKKRKSMGRQSGNYNDCGLDTLLRSKSNAGNNNNNNNNNRPRSSMKPRPKSAQLLLEQKEDTQSNNRNNNNNSSHRQSQQQKQGSTTMMMTSGGGGDSSLMGLFEGLEAELEKSVQSFSSSSNNTNTNQQQQQCKQVEGVLSNVEGELDKLVSEAVGVFGH